MSHFGCPKRSKFRKLPPLGIESEFYWRRSRPLSASGSFRASSTSLDGTILSASVKLKSNYNGDVDFVSLFEKWCALYKPNQGYLHYFTQPELEYDPLAGVEILYPAPKEQRVAEQLRSDWGTFRMGIFGALWNQKIFNLGAFNFLSSEFLSEQAAERLEADGFSIAELGDGYFFEIVQSLEAVKEDFLTFSKRRHRAKMLIGLDLFEIKSEPEPSI